MDIIEMLNKIQHFYEIVVPKAFCHADWNEQNITNAFEWVTFCEEMYIKCSGDVAVKLDTLLHSVGKKLNCYKTSLCFQDLKRSSILLTQAFFENPHVANTYIERILEKNNMCTIYTENLVDVVCLDSMCCDLIESLKPISFNDSDRSLYYEVKAELFLEYVRNFLEHMPTENQESHLTSAFENMLETDENMEILYHVLIYTPSCADAKMSEIQSFGMNWMLLNLYTYKNSKLVKFIWNQSSYNLRSLSAKHKEFHEYYMATIIKAADGFEKPNNSTCKQMGTGDLMLLFDQVLNHIQNLLALNDDLGKTTRSYILEHVNLNSEKSIWKELLCKIPILQK